MVKAAVYVNIDGEMVIIVGRILGEGTGRVTGSNFKREKNRSSDENPAKNKMLLKNARPNARKTHLGPRENPVTSTAKPYP